MKINNNEINHGEKFSLEKFEVARLKNLKKIHGGNSNNTPVITKDGDDPRTTDDLRPY